MEAQGYQKTKDKMGIRNPHTFYFFKIFNLLGRVGCFVANVY